MSIYDKNYVDGGYLLNYKTPELNTAEKRRVMQFRVELQDISPKIWRRIQVNSDCNFWDLHVAIQDAMGWLDYHLHHFEIKGKRKRKEVHIGIPDFHGLGGLQEVFPGWEVPVKDHFNDIGVTANYMYDYGDDWLHTVILEGYILKEEIEYPVCLAGARACPPEDCGGTYGYGNLLKTLNGRNHEDYEEYKESFDAEYEEIREWLGPDWEPEKFNLSDVRFFNPYSRFYNAFIKPSTL